MANNMARQLLARTRPDALFALGPRIAVGAATALRELGLRVPKDIALVGVDDFGMGSDLDPFMTVVRDLKSKWDGKLPQLLFDRISGRYDGPREK